jgi:hypothetical protein
MSMFEYKGFFFEKIDHSMQSQSCKEQYRAINTKTGTVIGVETLKYGSRQAFISTSFHDAFFERSYYFNESTFGDTYEEALDSVFAKARAWYRELTE